MPDVDITPAARAVIESLNRVPDVWDLLRDELDRLSAIKSHFQLRLDLTGQFGKVVDADVEVKLKRKRRKSGIRAEG